MKMMKPAKMGKVMPKATATKPAKVVPGKAPKAMKPSKKGY